MAHVAQLEATTAAVARVGGAAALVTQ